MSEWLKIQVERDEGVDQDVGQDKSALRYT